MMNQCVSHLLKLFIILFPGSKSTKIKAKQMAECDAELAAVLFSRQEKITKDDQPVREADAIRKRCMCSLCAYPVGGGGGVTPI